MFPYFGRKATMASLYPAPVYDTIVEPFAGSMAWTLHHRPVSAIGIEKDERVVALWHRMQGAEAVPDHPAVGSLTEDLLVKICSYSEHALTSGDMTVTSRMVRDWDFIWRRAMAFAKWTRGAIEYRLGSYEDAPDIEASWFIDPPYQRANRRGYLCGASGIEYSALAEWVRSRSGQVIVCEQDGADWLPFRPLADLVSHRGVRKTEMVWLPEFDR